jgi:hypothetical protein
MMCLSFLGSYEAQTKFIFVTQIFVARTKYLDPYIKHGIQFGKRAFPSCEK